MKQAQQYHGLSEAEIKEKIGKAKQSEDFRLADRQDEFHIELQNTYPIESNADLQIREMTWEQDNECNLTLWFHQKQNRWVVFESVLWDKTLEF